MSHTRQQGLGAAKVASSHLLWSGEAEFPRAHSIVAASGTPYRFLGNTAEVHLCLLVPCLRCSRTGFRDPGGSVYAALFRFFAHRAFINADSFFLAAALIGGRPLAFLETAARFFGPGLPFCFAHQAFFAAAILARAAALIRRRFGPLADLAWLPLGGRPRRAGCEPSPRRAAIACSIRLASCLSWSTML